jgi:hypothetical protein
MISLKMLSTAAALALLVPMVAPSASYAEGPKAGRAVGAGGTAFRAGGTPSMRTVGRAPATSFAAGAPAVRPSGGAAWNGGGGGAWDGYRHRDHDGRWWPGAVAAGAVIGGAIAANDAYAYYGGPVYGGPAYYDQPAYYDDQYVDDGAVAVVPVPAGEDSAAYCAQRYRSYDPASGTYLGFDGMRHPCP